MASKETIQFDQLDKLKQSYLADPVRFLAALADLNDTDLVRITKNFSIIKKDLVDFIYSDIPAIKFSWGTKGENDGTDNS